jgi:hypothetical protein
MTFEEALVFSGATLAAVAVMAWWVLRPFERARREREAQEHAAE